MKLTVLGPGCWGLTIAKLLNDNFEDICVWGRSSDISDELRQYKRTTNYEKDLTYCIIPYGSALHS